VAEEVVIGHAAAKDPNGPYKAKSTSIPVPAVVNCSINMSIFPAVAIFKYIHIGFGVDPKQPYAPILATPVVLQ
jgi:hypothetical protein